MNVQQGRVGMCPDKESTVSLGPATFRRTQRERKPDAAPISTDAADHKTTAAPASERTFISGSHSRRSMLVPGGGKSRGVSRPPEQPTYQRSSGTRFSPFTVERLVHEVLVGRLKDVEYDPTTCKALSQELAAIIMEELKALHIRRYKMVAVVSIGSLNERPRLQFGSRCLWDDATDNFASVKFTNGSIFAVVMIYGLYYE